MVTMVTTMVGEITSVSRANDTSKSLRTTIPVGVVRHLGITVGSKVHWEIKSIGGKLVAVMALINDEGG